MKYALLCLLLVGCNSIPKWDWQKPDGTKDELYRDNGQCNAQAIAAPVNQQGVWMIYDSCMEGKGWHNAAH